MYDKVYDNTKILLDSIKARIEDTVYLNDTLVNFQFSENIKEQIKKIPIVEILDEDIHDDTHLVISVNGKRIFAYLCFEENKFVFIDDENKTHEIDNVDEIEQLGYVAIIKLLQKYNGSIYRLKNSFIDYANTEYEALNKD